MSIPRISGPRLVDVDPERRQLLGELVAQRGIREAARVAGVGRVALLAIIARGTAPAAQLALLDRAFGVGPSLPAVTHTDARRLGGRTF